MNVYKEFIKTVYLLSYNLLLKNMPSANNAAAIGCRLRLFFLRPFLKSVGTLVNIQPGVYMHPLWNISIGNNSGIGRNSYIDAEDTVTIGNDVMIAPQLIIYTSTMRQKLERR